MDQPEDGVEHLGVVRLLLEAHELNVELIEALPGFGQEFISSTDGPTQARADKARAAAPAPLPVIVRNTGLSFVDHRKNSVRGGLGRFEVDLAVAGLDRDGHAGGRGDPPYNNWNGMGIDRHAIGPRTGFSLGR